MRAGEEVCDRDGQRQGGIVCAGNFIVDRVHTLSYWPEQGNLAHILHQDLGVGVVPPMSSPIWPRLDFQESWRRRDASALTRTEKSSKPALLLPASMSVG